MIWDENKLDELLTSPSDRLVSDMKKIEGDIIFLGAGGKMGPTLCVLAKNAIKKAGTNSKVIAVSRFTDQFAVKLLKDNKIDIIGADLSESGILEALPEVPNVIYMAGRKFGTTGQQYLTWASNVRLPLLVAERYKHSRIVVFSTGNVYPQMPVVSGGASEDEPPCPVGEYAMSCLGRERIFEYGAKTFGTKIAMLRLNYAIDLRYGVLYDIAQKLMSGAVISLKMPAFNCIWQGDAGEVALRSLIYADSDVFNLNVTGPQTVLVEHAAKELGKLLHKEAKFCDEPSDTALLSQSGKMEKIFGSVFVSMETMIQWQAEWILSGGRSLDKPTHFEEKKGDY